MSLTLSVYDSVSFTTNTENKMKIDLPIKKKGSSLGKDAVNASTIPYLPPEIIEHIVSFILIEISNYDAIYGNNYYTNYDNVNNTFNDNVNNNYDIEYTLLNIFTVFPYLLRQITPKLSFDAIPLHIYNFVYMKIDNVYDKLVMLFDNFKDRYTLNMWLGFITCEHSPFYNTREGIRFIYYILNKYSNHQQKKMNKHLLCNLLIHNDVIPIPKSLNNIIFNILVYNFKETSKLHLSLLTCKEKQLLLLYSISKVSNSYNYNSNVDDISKFLINVFKIYSTKLIDILSDNTLFRHIHYLNQNSLIDYILDNYSTNNYLLGSFIEYYLSDLLKFKNCNNLFYSEHITYTDIYFDIIGPILSKAIEKQHHDLIMLILNLKETTKSNLLYIISNDTLYNKIEYLELALYYITNYTKYTFNFIDLASFDWTHSIDFLNVKLVLYKTVKSTIDDVNNVNNIDNIHNLDKDLLYKICNYMIYHFNRLNMNLIFDKSFNFKTNSYDSNDHSRDVIIDFVRGITISTVSTYSKSIKDTLKSLEIKHEIDILYKYITRFYSLANKCSDIMKLILTKYNYNQSDKDSDSKSQKHTIYIKKYHKRIILIHNVYNFIVKHKLYFEPKLNATIKKASLSHLEQINTTSFNNVDTISNYKDTKQNRKIVGDILNLQAFITKIVELVNKV